MLACFHAGLPTSVWKKNVEDLKEVNSVTSRCVIVTSRVMARDKTFWPLLLGLLAKVVFLCFFAEEEIGGDGNI